MTKSEMQRLHERHMIVEKVPCRVNGMDQFPRVVVHMSLTEGQAMTLASALHEKKMLGNGIASDLAAFLANACSVAGIVL